MGPVATSPQLLFALRLATRLALGLALVGCAADPDVVPATHPCPSIALPPVESSLWDELLAPETAAPLALLVPLSSTTESVVSQGNAQLPTHLGSLAYAWDFEVPEGTPVLAAAPGVVVWVRVDSTDHGAEVGAVDDANWIVLDHGAGLFSAYVHLAVDSAEVGPGDVVTAGQQLAVTGLSGQLTGPHLHFQVENTWSESLPAAFIEIDAPRQCAWVPTPGMRVGRPDGVEQDLVWRGAASQLPVDAFASSGVSELNGAPARLMSRGVTYDLSGRVEPGLDEVWVLVLPEGGGEAVAGVGIPVEGERFAGTLDVSGLSPGRYGWAAVAVVAGSPAFVTTSVRLSVVD